MENGSNITAQMALRSGSPAISFKPLLSAAASTELSTKHKKNKTKKFKVGERGLLLLEALELIWYMEQGYAMQGKAKDFMKKCNYDFYNREPKFIK